MSESWEETAARLQSTMHTIAEEARKRELLERVSRDMDRAEQRFLEQVTTACRELQETLVSLTATSTVNLLPLAGTKYQRLVHLWVDVMGLISMFERQNDFTKKVDTAIDLLKQPNTGGERREEGK